LAGQQVPFNLLIRWHLWEEVNRYGLCYVYD
jgi:hypothetical protein